MTAHQSAEKVERLLESLHPLEIKVLPHLAKHSNVRELEEASGLQEVEVIRALQWMSNKKIIDTPVKKFTELVELDELGKRYLGEGLPERRFLEAAEKNTKIGDITSAAKLDKEEVNLCLGLLRRKVAIDIKKGKGGLTITLTKQGNELLKKESFEEQFIKTLNEGPRPVDTLKDVERFAFDELKKRKDIIRLKTEWSMSVSLTNMGKGLLKTFSSSGIAGKDIIETLTPKMLRDGSWKGKKFRRYDVGINVPAVYPGKRHFVNQAIEYARRIWLDLGFKEMTGPLLQPAFWNFDALFTAQDHPVREMQDTYYIKKPGVAQLPEKKLVDKIRAVHETGGNTGSAGWSYSWNPNEAKRNVLRTHTTVLSARTLAALKKEDLPAKYFALGVNFRNEAIDWSHNIEFNQTEGIVIDEDANFRHLLGYLKKFFRKMGYPDARFRPAYFPYTEMSVEIDVFHPVHKKWVELGGAGMFRPEVVVPLLGKDIPVLAWGPGFDRTITEYFDINDIRDLYSNDMRQLREMKLWMK